MNARLFVHPDDRVVNVLVELAAVVDGANLVAVHFDVGSKVVYNLLFDLSVELHSLIAVHVEHLYILMETDNTVCDMLERFLVVLDALQFFGQVFEPELVFRLHFANEITKTCDLVVEGHLEFRAPALHFHLVLLDPLEE